MKHSIDRNRRQFLKTLALGAATFSVGSLLSSLFSGRSSQAFASDLPEVAENDPTAIALGYVSNGKKADIKKFPKAKDAHSGTQKCANCMFFSNEKAGKGSCQLFPGKLVKSAGWCNSWAKKT
ncbi:MAG: high-potential iron-sulfur protein [Bdellovibrionaceae bacterium]|nr:high-potential iron-sulfur protein [Pseudobdellovibrionaceae bacterium]